MTVEIKQNPTLVIIFSILGVMSVALLAGLLLMQKQEGRNFNLGSALSFQQELPPTDDFDPISWARDGAAYPPLQENDETTGDLITDYNGTRAIPEEEPDVSLDEKPAEEPDVSLDEKPAERRDTNVELEAVPQPVLIHPVSGGSSSPRLVQATKFREITESAYWVQVFSSSDLSSAELVRDKLTDQGMSSTVQIKEINSSLRYRVRLGAFTRRSEAEYYAVIMRKIAGFESSYVVEAPVTRQLPMNG